MQHDSITHKILQILSEDGRISNQALAQAVGLSPSACLRRVQELERSGVIRGYRARLDAETAGRGFIVCVAVGLSSHSRAAQRAFEAALAPVPEVVECHNIAGAFEYLLRVETSDMRSYKAFHDDVLGTIREVRSITSHIVLGSAKDSRA
ncbi:Lrp/AsnC family transcriptional regulator [Pseudoroseicyclus aestuarii]|uniref:AsnC family transcriptional regulator n=1 Tax=Pseudoroseicyclus aestuarii TaxID=1795041 RepID=A0A318T0B3_9RHOB|nr:Lrp/AsnC family transcriptional regulator [Pseudoroseicyclus aestuarii]PYE82537.1 AsnC family transcriptional regulator [Pseudoroseicyclus aestuarii]